ncbi:PD-(D/E)XK nuclease family protein [Psychroserpens sp. S379A]|uniref:PD-(D/E)XK nuclease family protein n=1 Tax=Psychroserpens sp. S379A TaxID=3415137 RepID=UPI003C79E060
MKDELNLLKKDKARLKELQYLVEMEEWITEEYEANYERLRLEGGHALSPEVKRQGLLQVLMYFRKMREVAETVTETEVKLTLPEQTSPKGNKFTIEGVVDIIREKDSTTMYDVKTHDADYVKANKEDYIDQLNVYTHIWQNLRNETLNGTAIIATQFPRTLKKAIDADEEEKLIRELEKWNPVIPIPFSQEKVEDTINKFACVVDRIENREFHPPSVDELQERIKGTKQRFATRVCRNCDARFSCDAYREYAQKSSSFSGGFAQYINDLGNSDEVENFTNTNAFETPPPNDINDLI